MKKYPYHASPRCEAKTKRNNGNPCRSPAVRNKKRCRIHGGGKGSGAQTENANALKHGETTAVAKRFRKRVKMVLNKSASLAKVLTTESDSS